MEVVIVVPPRTHLGEPGAVLAGLLAQNLLDGGMHEDTRDLRIGRRTSDQLGVERRPHIWIDGKRILQHGCRGDVLTLLRGEGAIRHRREPNIGVESDLMAGMAGQHRSAARLRHVADEKTRPAVEPSRVACQTLEIVQQPRMSPIAVARKSHHLPVGAVDRKCHAAGETAS